MYSACAHSRKCSRAARVQPHPPPARLCPRRHRVRSWCSFPLHQRTCPRSFAATSFGSRLCHVLPTASLRQHRGRACCTCSMAVAVRTRRTAARRSRGPCATRPRRRASDPWSYAVRTCRAKRTGTTSNAAPPRGRPGRIISSTRPLRKLGGLATGTCCSLSQMCCPCGQAGSTTWFA